MLKNINEVFASLGLDARNRALQIQLSNKAIQTEVFIQRIDGEHHINQALTAELYCLSRHAHIPLKQFIGCRAAVDQVTDFGELFRTSGIITAASQGQSDGALTVYKLTMQDATNLWHKRTNSRVFMNKTVCEITEILFKEWQSKSSLFAASLSLDLKSLQREYDIRPFVMQINESDYDFLTRLWRSEGINWLIDETQHTVMMSMSEIHPQKLRLIDDNALFDALKRREIRFHRSHATERFDTITSIVAQRQLRSSTVQAHRWQPDALFVDQDSTLLSVHQHSAQYENETLSLEQAWSLSPAWTADLNGEDQATRSSSAQLEQLNTQLGQYQDFKSKYFTAISSVRDAQVGYWFEFNGHPEIDLHDRSDREFLIIGKSFFNQNNLPKDLMTQVNQLLTQSNWKQPDGDERQANQLTLVRRHIPVVPEYLPLKHRPAAYPQRAKVVGPAGEVIHVDEWGRIKVRFLFTREQDHQHDGGAGSNENDSDSAWVDVLTTWAGEGYGARFHPRVGEIVVIDFFDGNVDRPFVLGRIHEAERLQTKFDGKGPLPATKKLSGIRSQEVSGAGFNQLRFDDTTGQISAQLQSSYEVSQLNLGKLSHPKESESSDGRGEGFELRTDAWGAVRAGKGMLITTYAQEKAIADHLDSAQALSLLQQGQESMSMLSSIAEKQQTDALDVISRLPKFIQSLELKSQSQALNRTVNLFKEGIGADPVNALKDCGGFIEDVGKLGGSAGGIVDEFNQYFNNVQDAVSNLKEFIEKVQEQGSDAVKAKFLEIKDKLSNQPLEALKEIGKVLVNVDIKEIDLICGGGIGGGINQSMTPSIALNSLKNFMEGHTSNLEQSSNAKDIEQGKLFRQALMLLASPNGIALTTPEDIILQASQDIAESAQGSINLSAQKNIIAQAQDKVSVFAAQKGINAFAAKGKIQVQAQDDAIEAIARKVIKLISTEDKIELTSAKEIDLKAGGSQIIVNSKGVFIKTNGKFESKAGQHVFMSGEVVNAELPKMPEVGIFSRRFDFGGIFDYQKLLAPIQYKVINKSKNTQSVGYLDEEARTPRFFGDEEDEIEVTLLNSLTADDKWRVLDVDEQDQTGRVGEEECCSACDDEEHDCHNENDTASINGDLDSDYLNFGS